MFEGVNAQTDRRSLLGSGELKILKQDLWLLNVFHAKLTIEHEVSTTKTKILKRRDFSLLNIFRWCL